MLKMKKINLRNDNNKILRVLTFITTVKTFESLLLFYSGQKNNPLGSHNSKQY